MRFVVTLYKRDITFAQMSIDPAPQEGVPAFIERACSSLRKDAGDRIEKSKLDRICNELALFISTKLLAPQSSQWTVICKDDHIHAMEGQVAIITEPTDIVGIFKLMDDAEIAHISAILDDILTPRAPA